MSAILSQWMETATSVETENLTQARNVMISTLWTTMDAAAPVRRSHSTRALEQAKSLASIWVLFELVMSSSNRLKPKSELN